MSDDQKLVKIAFICTANAARSQMAEGIARQLAADHVVVQSAGSAPCGSVARMAVEVTRQLQIDISTHYSKGFDQLDRDLDYIITLCDNAMRYCPIPSDGGIHLHWSIPDPGALCGPGESIQAGYRRARDKIADLIGQFLAEQGLLK